ncbi:hypothetical protein ACO0K3_03665 [Undibacterium sp. Rencai35W]|uniref:hypothetical protein n=1 Tax=Undibacterium sp. Rencai35W TaxID=3413046 RepID=UPI003BEFB913
MAFASTTTNDFLIGRTPTPTPSNSSDVTVRFKLPFVAGDLTLNNLGNIGILPAGCVPVALLIDSDKLDTNGTPTIAWQLGISNAAVVNNVQGAGGTAISALTADGGAAWATAQTVSQNGGQVQALSKALSRVTPTTYDRYIMIQATAAAATAAAGEAAIIFTYRFA